MEKEQWAVTEIETDTMLTRIIGPFESKEEAEKHAMELCERKCQKHGWKSASDEGEFSAVNGEETENIWRIQRMSRI